MVRFLLKLWFALFSFLMLLTACHQSARGRMWQILEKVESLMPSNPDSAYRLLSEIQLPPHRGEAGAFYALLLSRAMWETGRQPLHDSLLKVACRFYRRSHDTLRMAWCYYGLARFYEANDSNGLQAHFLMSLARAASSGTGDTLLKRLLATGADMRHDDFTYFYQKVGEERRWAISAKRRGDHAGAARHWERCVNLIDSCYLEKRRDSLYAVSQVVALQAQNRQEIDEKVRRLRVLLVLVVILVVYVAGSTLVYQLKRYKRKSMEAIRLRKALLDQTLLHLQERNNELLNQQRLMCERVCQMRNETAAQLSQLHEEREILRRHLLETNETVRKIMKLRTLSVSKKIKGRYTLLLTQKERSLFYVALNQCYDGWEQNLRRAYPALTDDDVYTCCLLRMGIDKLDIALLLDCNADALKKRKYRIKCDKMRIRQSKITLEECLMCFNAFPSSPTSS